MGLVQRTEGDVFVAGSFSANEIALPASTVNNDDVAAAACIAATKLDHQYAKVVQQESATAATDVAHVNHVAYGAGNVIAFKVGAVVAPVGVAAIAVDLLKNGATVLTGTVAINSTTCTADRKSVV